MSMSHEWDIKNGSLQEAKGVLRIIESGAPTMLERLGSIGLLFFLGGGRDEVQDWTLGNGRATWLVIDKSPLYKQKDHICMGARDRRDRIFGMGMALGWAGRYTHWAFGGGRFGAR